MERIRTLTGPITRTVSKLLRASLSLFGKWRQYSLILQQSLARPCTNFLGLLPHNLYFLYMTVAFSVSLSGILRPGSVFDPCTQQGSGVGELPLWEQPSTNEECKLLNMVNNYTPFLVLYWKNWKK